MAPPAPAAARRLLDPFDLPPIPALFFSPFPAHVTVNWLVDHDNAEIYLRDDLAPAAARVAWVEAFADFVHASEARPQLVAVGAR